MMYESRESYWDRRNEGLNSIRDQLSSRQRKTTITSPQFKPLSDRHPLLLDTHHNDHAAYTGSRANSPPAHLPKLKPYNQGQGSPHQSASSLRGARYERVPPVAKRNAFDENPGAGYESWGEEGGSGSDYDDYAAKYPSQYAYPVIMYPVVPTHYRKKQRKGKKHVRYRNTPMYLNSRENTRHLPVQFHRLQDSPRFTYIDTSHQGQDYFDPFNPRTNPVLARYQYPFDGTSLTSDLLQDRRPDPSSYFTNEPAFAHKYVDDFISGYLESELVPNVLIDAISRDKRGKNLWSMSDHEGRLYHRPDPLKEFLDDVVDELVMEEGILAVRESVNNLADEHLAKGATYDIVMELVTEEVYMFGPDIAREAIFENIMEDLILEEMIDPEIEPIVKEVAIETIKQFNNKARRQDIRELKRHSGHKTINAYCLDYLLSLIARKGMLWNQGEQVTLLFDSTLLNILLEQFQDVGQKRQDTSHNKPLRRMHEKATTDVAVGVLLGELRQTLEEDMADLDEYERGLELPLDTQNTSELQRWLEGR